MVDSLYIRITFIMLYHFKFTNILRLYFSLFSNHKLIQAYEAWKLFRLGVFWCRTLVSVKQHNTYIYDYTDLYHFFKLLLVLACQYPFYVRCMCLNLCPHIPSSWWVGLENIFLNEIKPNLMVPQILVSVQQHDT